MVGDITAMIAWEKVIANLKKEYPLLHVFYSSEDGWANLSYKRNFERIDNSMTEMQVRLAVLKMFDENIF